jgi:hypothetical protein
MNKKILRYIMAEISFGALGDLSTGSENLLSPPSSVPQFIYTKSKNSKKFVYYNENMYTNSNFKCNYLENYDDSEHAVKTKNAPFFMNFPKISTKWNNFLQNGVLSFTNKKLQSPGCFK